MVWCIKRSVASNRDRSICFDSFGYLSGDILKTLGLDTVLEETSAKPGEVTVVEVETPQSTTNQEQARTENQVVETEEAPKEEAPKTEESPKEEPKSEIKPTDDTLPKVEEGKKIQQNQLQLKK